MREAVSSLSTTTLNSRLPAVTCAAHPQLMMPSKPLHGLHCMRCKELYPSAEVLKIQRLLSGWASECPASLSGI